MPRIDPLQLLTCLNVLLAKNGGVLSHAEVERLAKLMGRYSKKLVSKCIYIQILKCTKTDLLGEFMRVGGWALTHTWLTDGIRGKNWPLVQEILELLLLCPVDVQRLKSNSAPKLVKQLSKDGGNEGVRIYATRLVEQWLNVVKSETKTTTNDETNIISPIAAMTSPTVATTSSNNITPGQQEEDIKTIDSESSSSAQLIVKNLLSSPTSSSEQKIQRKSSTDSGVMYKIIVKDGKQILSKIENSTTPTKENCTTPAETTTSTTAKMEIDCDGNNDNNEIELKSDDTIANKENDKKSVEKDNKDSKQKSKSSSSSSKDKHKSSSNHRSSSKSSSSKSNSSSKSKSSSVSSSSSHHRSSTDSKSRDGGKERSDKQKSSSSSSSKYSSKDKHRSEKSTTNNIKDKDKEKADQAEKDKETLSKILPPTLDKLGKIPRKVKDEITNNAANGGAKQTSVNQSITIPSKKASMSIEIRKDTDKTKTVKTYKSQFRSHGLTEEAPPPPSRKNLKKPSSLSLPGTTIPPSIPTISNSLSSLKRSSPPPQSITSTITEPLSPKDSSVFPPSDKKPKIDLTSLPVNAIEKPGAIKLIAPKPKPASLVESDMFMDALFASAVPKKDARKRKRRTSGSKEPSSPSDSPVTVKAAPLKFYQDTLEEKDDNNKSDSSGCATEINLKEKDNNKIDANIAADDEDDDIPLKKVKEDIEEKCRQQEKDDDNSQDKSQNSLDDDDDLEMIENIKKPPGPGCGPDGPPGVLMLHRRRGPKKSLKWRPQEQLEEIRFFELDETERVNVTKTFTDAKQMERCNEREQFLMHRKVGSEDLMVEQTPWITPLILCDDVPTHPDGSQSKEKKIQCEREQTTLKALYFSRAMIPDSASEPDMEHSQITEPAVIPLDDITGNPDAVNDYMKYGWPEPKGTPPRNLIDDNTNLGGMSGVMGGRGGGVLNDNDMKFQNNQFNPFLPFGGGGGVNNIGQQNSPWSIGGGQQNNIQNGGPGVILPPNLMAGPMNNPFQLPGNIIPQNIMMNMNGGGQQMSPSDIQNNLMPPFGQVGPSNFGPPNGIMNGPIGPMVAPLMGNNNNFGGPPMNMNGIPNMNMNNGPMRGGMNNQMNRNNNGGGGGNWRSGGPSNNSGINNNIGNNWRGGGGGGGGGANPRNWVHGGGGRGICKSFMRGFCRNGNKCNYIHPGPNNNNNRI